MNAQTSTSAILRRTSAGRRRLRHRAPRDREDQPRLSRAAFAGDAGRGSGRDTDRPAEAVHPLGRPVAEGLPAGGDADHARKLLDGGMPLLETSYEVGMSGPGRLHDLFVTHEAMSPGDYKTRGEGLTIRYGYHISPFGVGLVMVTDRGLAGLSFNDPGEERAAFADMSGRWPNANYVEECRRRRPLRHASSTRPMACRPAAACGADRHRLPGAGVAGAPKDPHGPRSQLSSDRPEIGKPAASRAVGAAVGANPISFVVPCHRALGKSGALTGYHWGLTRKRAILGWEAGQIAHCVGQARSRDGDSKLVDKMPSLPAEQSGGVHLITVIGSINLDLIGNVARLPAPGETVPSLGFKPRRAARAPTRRWRRRAPAAGAHDRRCRQGQLRRPRPGLPPAASIWQRARAARLDGRRVDLRRRGGKNVIVVIPGANGRSRPEISPSRFRRARWCCCSTRSRWARSKPPATRPRPARLTFSTPRPFASRPQAFARQGRLCRRQRDRVRPLRQGTEAFRKDRAARMQAFAADRRTIIVTLGPRASRPPAESV